jgi:hypothetical protein
LDAGDAAAGRMAIGVYLKRSVNLTTRTLLLAKAERVSGDVLVFGADVLRLGRVVAGWGRRAAHELLGEGRAVLGHDGDLEPLAEEVTPGDGLERGLVESLPRLAQPVEIRAVRAVKHVVERVAEPPRLCELFERRVASEEASEAFNLRFRNAPLESLRIEVERSAQREEGVLRTEGAEPEGHHLLSPHEVRERETRPSVLLEVFGVRVVAIVEPAPLPELVIEAPGRLPMQTHVVGEELHGGEIGVFAGEVRSEPHRDRGRVGARLVDDEHAETARSAGLGKRGPRRGAGRKRAEIVGEALLEPVRKAPLDAEKGTIAAKDPCPMGPYVLDGQSREARLGADGGMSIRVAFVERRSERFLPQRFVVRTPKLVRELARRARAHAIDRRLVQTRG